MKEILGVLIFVWVAQTPASLGGEEVKRMISMRPRLRVWNGGDRPVSMIRYACPA